MRARQTRLEARKAPPKDNSSSEDEIECTGWNGGILHCVSSDNEPIVISDDDSEEFIELSGSEPEEVSEEHPGMTDTIVQIGPKTTPHSVIMHGQTKKGWTKAESHGGLGYNGLSAWTKRHHDQIAREKEKEDARLRNG